ncbi:MAG: tRNA (guanosine(37)-N1)-methyltransferase TrmD [Micromonosporaceae bacterium]
MLIEIVTIFPEYFAPLELSLVRRARETGLLDTRVHDLRRWTHDVHRTVDDTPYGGGPGMVMRPEPWGEALDELLRRGGPAGEGAGPRAAGAEPSGGEPGGGESSGESSAPGPADADIGTAEPLPVLVAPTPAGTPFTQEVARQLAAAPWLIFACGRYEGIDQRVLDEAASRMPVQEISIGDYVLFGGEVATLAMIEAITRLLPGVLGNADSLLEESHAEGLLEAPMYTKPAVWRGRAAPDVLRSGDHARIARWRRDQSLLRTGDRRPDLIARLSPDRLDRADRETLRGGGFQVPDPDMAE